MDDAFREAVERVLPAVWRCLRRFGVYPQEMDDALQVVLLKMFRHWTKVRQSDARGMQTFACCVSVGVARDVVRARVRSWHRTLPLDEGLVDRTDDPSARAEHRQAIAIVDAVLEMMPVGRREIFILYEIEGLTAKEIAGELGIPEGTVASRLRTARAEFEAGLQRRSKKEGSP